MKIYNETLLRNEYAQKLVLRFQKEGLLSDTQAVEIRQLHADVPYNPNIFIKIVLFLFGGFGFSFGSSFVALAVLGESFVGFAIISMIYGVGTLFALKYFIRERKLHFSGLDNALLYCVLGSFGPMVFQIYDSAKIDELWVGALLFLPFLLAAAYSFGEPLVALGAFLATLFIIASILMKNPLGKALLPFALMICTGITYEVVRRFLKKEASFYWQTALYWVSIAALVLFYAAGNYLVVRQANAALNGLPDPAPEIAFAPLFWGLTFLVPVLYFFGGFRWRDRTLITLGILAVVCSILTVRFYHAVLPAEWGMILGGIAASSIAYVVIRQLKTPKYGFSFAPEVGENASFRIETVVLSQITTNIQTADNGVQFGGGDFGGGGAGEKY